MATDRHGQDDIPDPRRDFFDDQAPTWDSQGPDAGEVLRRLTDLRDRLGFKPSEAVVEIGCGTGQVTPWLAQQICPGRVVGVDFSSEMIAHARSRNPQLAFRLADVCRDDLGTECFDAALCFHSFPHFRDQPSAVRFIARALVPGGRLIVVHLAGREHINAFHTGVGGAVAQDHLPGADDWQGLVQPCGLTLVELIDREDLFLMRAVKRSDDADLG